MLKYFVVLITLLLLIYTRFINLQWGLPYPLHPDERNMADAMMRFTCDQKQPLLNVQPDNLSQMGHIGSLIRCLNPHFFAYGQLPLYIGYAMVLAWHSLKGLPMPMDFFEAVMALRVISALSSILTVFFLMQIFFFVVSLFYKHQKISYDEEVFFSVVAGVLCTFSPVLIQFAHFGTTESLLIFFYIVLIYISLKVLNNMESLPVYLLMAGIICGLAMATKVSSIVYAALPAYCVLHRKEGEENILERIVFRAVSLARFTTVIMFIGLFLSPYNLIAFSEFVGSFQYESSVALGKMDVFYTRQFHQTVPILFQFQRIFPYTLGWGILILFGIGFLLLPWNNRYLNLLRVSFLLTFLPNAFVYAKWTRFIAPVYPVMILFAVLLIFHWYKKFIHEFKVHTSRGKLITLMVIIVLSGIVSLPGIAFLSIYQNPDVRFVASHWIFKNLPGDSYILSETANVVDLPIPAPEDIVNKTDFSFANYKYKSFNFYDLDTEPIIQEDLEPQIKSATYIFIPSRRLFLNHTCYEAYNPFVINRISNPEYRSFIRLQQAMDRKCAYNLQKYPLLNQYYKKLFSGESGFAEVVEFTSYPRIQIFGKTLFEFPDESAEETWTVFDHPVIRIYKKV